MTPILLLGAGRMGGALIEGWRAPGAFARGRPDRSAIRSPCRRRRWPPRARGSIRPTPALAARRTVLLAVKPQIWREAAAEVAPLLAPDAVIVSIAAGVARRRHRHGLRRPPRGAGHADHGRRHRPGHRLASSPTTRRPAPRAHALFEPVATVVDLADEDLMHAATAVSGSAPAYLYAFIEALEAAGVGRGPARRRPPRPWPAPPSPAPRPCWPQPARTRPTCAARSPRPAAPPRRR